jgi:hypothetical protein
MLQQFLMTKMDKVPGFNSAGFVHGGDPLAINSARATVTSVNAAAGYPKFGVAGDRSAILLATAAGSAAVTDGTQIQFAVTTGFLKNSVPASSLKPIVFNRGAKFACGFYAASDIATMEMFFGFAAIDTTVIASLPTDAAGLLKLTGDANFRLYGRKASGTAESNLIGNMPTLANASWIDLMFEWVPTATGEGYVTVFAKVGGLAGESLSEIGKIKLVTQSPDTVLLAPTVAWRVGTSAAQPEVAISHVAWIHTNR